MAESFSDYMQAFLREKNPTDVLEVGSDMQLRLALKLAPYCQNFYSVNFPDEHRQMEGWLGMHKVMGGVDNIRFLSGNAVQLSGLISHADVIIVHNVLLDLNGEDTTLMWKYRRGELECSEEQWQELVSRFRSAGERGYKEFLKVANPGYIVRFGRPAEDQEFRTLAEKLGVEPSRIETRELLYDGLDKTWMAHIMDNS